MKLTVKNFGPIKEAKNINIDPMMIFVGPSNTGKSYLAILIYSIINVLGDIQERGDISHYILHGTKETDKELADYVEEIFLAGIEENRQEIYEKVEKVINGCFSNWAEFIAYSLKGKILYCFGEEGKKMIEGNNDNDLILTITDSQDQLTLNLFSQNSSSPGKNQLRNSQKKKIAKSIVEKLSQKRWRSRVYSVRSFTQAICDEFASSLIENGGRFNQSHYLPAIRGGIMQSHRTLVSALIERAPMAGLMDQLPPIPAFNGVLSDFMQKLINIPAAKRRRRRHRAPYRHFEKEEEEQKKIQKIGSEIESHIMGGEITINPSETNYPDFSYTFEKEQKHDLPLMNASSMVSELAPVSLFIRNYVRYGDLFILEEPEAHLHPGGQREISKVLVQLVNAGVHVLITTHSDTILEQIGNCIQATKMPEKKLSRQWSKKGQTLEENKCAIYYFRRTRDKRTTVEKIPFDAETGILTKDHLDISSDLYNETVGLLQE